MTFMFVIINFLRSRIKLTKIKIFVVRYRLFRWVVVKFARAHKIARGDKYALWHKIAR